MEIRKWQPLSFIRKNAKWINEIFCSQFSVEHSSFIQKMPENFGISNLRFMYYDLFFPQDSYVLPYNRYLDFRKAYAFDESNGLQWEDKVKQQKKRNEEIINLVKKLNIKYKRVEKMR